MSATSHPVKHLEGIIQESIQRTHGDRVWMRIIAQAIRIGEFRRHMESYGEQRVSMTWREVPGAEPAEMPVGLLMRATAEVLKSDPDTVLFEAGRHWFASLGRVKSLLEPRSVSPALLLYGLMRLQGSCRWMGEVLELDSVRVICSPESGALSLGCRLTDERLWPFLTGILSGIDSARSRKVLHEVQKDALQRNEHIFTLGLAGEEKKRSPQQDVARLQGPVVRTIRFTASENLRTERNSGRAEGGMPATRRDQAVEAAVAAL